MKARALGCILATAAALSGDDPKWLPAFPNPSKNVSSSASPDKIVEYFKAELKNSGIDYSPSFDGIGPTIRVVHDGTSCVIRVRDSGNSSAVKSLCVPLGTERETATWVPVSPATQTAAPAPAPKERTDKDPMPSSRQLIEYDVTGWSSVKTNVEELVDITMNNEHGVVEQLRTKTPFHLEFWAEPGFETYLSAQKWITTYTDNSHVHPLQVRIEDNQIRARIVAGKRLINEAVTAKPFGVATAKGVVPVWVVRP